MELDGKTTIVATIPNCDINSSHGPAYADAKLIEGPWAYVCKQCFELHECKLGLSRGQILITKEETQ